MSPNLTPNDKLVLCGLCSDPWANDRELAQTHKINMSTVTSCKNRLKCDGVFKKAYFPAYHRLGYPVLSISQLRMDIPPEALLKALGKYKGRKILF